MGMISYLPLRSMAEPSDKEALAILESLDWDDKAVDSVHHESLEEELVEDSECIPDGSPPTSIIQDIVDSMNQIMREEEKNSTSNEFKAVLLASEQEIGSENQTSKLAKSIPKDLLKEWIKEQESQTNDNDLEQVIVTERDRAAKVAEDLEKMFD